jgi:O-antigen/teichoic acid export membrane protein
VWARPIIDLALGPGYGKSAQLIQLLVPYVFVSGLAGPVSSGLNYLGEARRRLPIAAVDVTLTAALMPVLLATWGLNGAAIGADVVSFVYVALCLGVIRRLIDVPLQPLALTLGRSLLAAAAMTAVLQAFGTDHLTPLDWIAGGAAGLAAFAAVAIALGEVTLAQLRELPRWVASRRR